MIVWLNGELTEHARLDATSAGLLLGWGVFTTIGIRGGTPLLFEPHCARLRRDAAATRIALPWSDQALHAGLNATLRANEVTNGIARLTLLRRDDGRWNTEAGSDALILAQSTVSHAQIAHEQTAVRLMVSSHRTSAQHALAGVKTTSYLPYLLAWQEAREAGYDEALLLTTDDALCEGARTTFFWVQGDELYTPGLETGALAGVGREWVLAWARAHGVAVNQGDFRLHPDLELAQEAFVMAAANGPRPVTLVCAPPASQEFTFPVMGPLTRALREAWEQL